MRLRFNKKWRLKYAGSWILGLLQTDAVIRLIIGAFVTYLVKWLASAQGANWKNYEGYAITAVKGG